MKMRKIVTMQYRTSGYADACIYASWGGNQVNGKKGTARAKSGGKHYIRSRVRAKENAKLQKEVSMLAV